MPHRTPPFFRHGHSRKTGLFTARNLARALTLGTAMATGYWAMGATLIWDANPANSAPDDGSSTTSWSTTSIVKNWWDGTTNVVWTDSTFANPIFAQFGSGGTGAKTVSVAGPVTVAGLSFAALGAAVTGYTLQSDATTAGSINIAGDGVNSGTITIADSLSTSGSFLSLNVALAGNNVTIQKAAGSTTEQFLQLGATNNWTGKLTIAAGNGSLFVRTTGSGALNSQTVTPNTVEVQSGNTLALMGTNNTYTSNFLVGGTGSASRGVLRFDNNMTLTGTITMSSSALLNFQTSGALASNVLFTGGIAEATAGQIFSKTGLGTLTLQGASTYTGGTVVAPTTVASDPGALALDFTGATSPVTDILYNGVAKGALTLTGNTTRVSGAASIATLTVTGKASTTNSQTFGGLTVTGPTAITVTSGTGGSTTLNLGAITRSGTGTTLALTGPASGSITTSTNVGGLLGTWSSYTTAAGVTTWAGSNGTGALGNFTGETAYVTGANLTGSTANYNISSASTGAVAQSGSVAINTLSMTDTVNARTVTVGAGNTLTLGSTSTLGGVQLVAGAKTLTIGSAVSTGTLTAGTGVAELAFSNFDATSTITVNSVIANNAAAVSVVSNGTGTTVLAGANTYTGSTLIYSGIVEARNATALGSAATGATTVASGAVLQLSGGITIAEAITLYGSGVSSGGALRNVSGSNTSGGVITLGSGGARITADAGTTLTLFRTNATTNVIAGTGNAVTFGGAGTISVGSVIATGAAGTLGKVDSGTLILGAANTYTGATTVAGGVIRVTNALGLGTNASGTTVNSGAAVEIANSTGSTMALTEAFSLNGSGINNGGALRITTGNVTTSATVNLVTAARINVDAGASLTIDVATGNAIGGTVGLTLGGAGTITVADAIASVAVNKDGTGTFAYGASDLIGNTSSLSVNNGVLALGAFSDTVGSVTLQNGSITGTGTLTGTGYTLQNGSISANLGGTGAINKTTNGTVTLSGTNTTTGAATVSAGRLVLDYSTGTPLLAANALNLNGATLEIKGNGSATNVSIGAFILGNTNGLSSIVVGTNVAVTSAGATRNSASGVFFDLSAAGSSFSFTGGASLPAVTNGVLTIGTNAAAVMKDANGRYDFAALNGSNSVVRLNATDALPQSGGTAAVSRVLTAAGGTFGLTDDTTVSTLRIDTTANSGTLDLAGKNLNVNLLGILVDGSNDFTITNSNASAGFLTNTSGIFLYQYSTGKLTLDAKISSQAFLMGNGLIDWTAAAGSNQNNYILGATVRLTGTALTLDNGTGTGNGTGLLSIGNNGILELTTADFNRAVGAAANNNVRFIGDGGGFSAFGANRAVNFGADGRMVTFGVGTFLASGSKLILGSPYANATVDFQNALSLAGANQFIDVQSANITGVGGKISGNITGAAGSALTKIGQGILTLSGANTYAGATNINAGTLIVSGSISGGTNVSVAAGAKFQITGTGTVAADTLALADTSTLSLEIAALTSTKITLTNTATFAGHVDLALALTADPTDGTLFTLIDGNNAVLGLTSTSRFYYNGLALGEGSLFTVNSGGFSQTFQISYAGGADGSDITLAAVVPEPGALASLLAASGMLAGLQRFRRRRS